MPVRSLHSSVTRWPSRAETFESFKAWAKEQFRRRADITRIGCFGSIVKGTWGVGSDIDIIIVLAESGTPPLRRAAQWDTTPLPVPADLVVLTEEEARDSHSPRFKHVLERETAWVKKE